MSDNVAVRVCRFVKHTRWKIRFHLFDGDIKKRNDIFTSCSIKKANDFSIESIWTKNSFISFSLTITKRVINVTVPYTNVGATVAENSPNIFHH